ncbi:sulfite exporter TauE/SafE family protein [Nitrosomonas sp.]|uniref:sulfite exporter TauE/SafE family protein n=1 Tax=Nitrosomonas sp. TaxID=42353 RepID=UPI0025F8F0D9|nr:sulfite exporter TauE/SafE family protein [Nitrosomonas sp.]
MAPVLALTDAGGTIIAVTGILVAPAGIWLKKVIWGWPCVRALGYSGIATGFISGLLGVDGGFVVVPALKRATNLPMQSILATSLAVIALISGIGVASAIFLGGMNWPVALPFAAGALIGMLIGRGIADYLAEPELQQGFAVVSMGIAVWMIVWLFWMS